MIKIDWNDILNKSIAALVTSVFLGAGIVIWQGVNSIQSKIDTATEKIHRQNDYTLKAVEVIESEIITLKSDIKYLSEDIKELKLRDPLGYLWNVSPPVSSTEENSSIPPASSSETENISDLFEPISSNFIQDQLPNITGDY